MNTDFWNMDSGFAAVRRPGMTAYSDVYVRSPGSALMERKRAADFPQELLNLFDGYVHGGISRRKFLDGAQRFAVGGVTATALFQQA